MKILQTVDEVIALFGGPSQAAREFGYERPSGVAWWRIRGIAPGHALTVALRAKLRGYRLSNDLLGLSDEEYRALYSECEDAAA
jgi:hypothetical protein